MSVLRPSWTTVRHGLPQDNDVGWWVGWGWECVALSKLSVPAVGGCGKERKSTQWNGTLASVKIADTEKGFRKFW